MSKADRAQNVQTPGAEAPTDEQGAGQDAATGVDGSVGEQPALAPDIQAMVQMEVARTLARERASRAAAQAGPAGAELPTQAEALAKVKEDPNHRSVLSKDGWVTVAEAGKPGFAKA